MIFTGNTLTIGSIGNSVIDNYQKVYHSLQKLRGFPNETLLFPSINVVSKNLLFAKMIDPEN